jgi:NAD dependent epimerase/dehydratase family enzyme
MSWIAVDDMLGVILHALTDRSVRGPINTVAPRAVTNYEFTKTLGKVLHRPTVLPLPAFAVKVLFGEMGDALLLGSTRVTPRFLNESGFEFAYPELEAALRHLLGR